MLQSQFVYSSIVRKIQHLKQEWKMFNLLLNDAYREDNEWNCYVYSQSLSRNFYEQFQYHMLKLLYLPSQYSLQKDVMKQGSVRPFMILQRICLFFDEKVSQDLYEDITKFCDTLIDISYNNGNPSPFLNETYEKDSVKISRCKIILYGLYDIFEELVVSHKDGYIYKTKEKIESLKKKVQQSEQWTLERKIVTLKLKRKDNENM